MMSYCSLRHDCLTYSLWSVMQTNGDVNHFIMIVVSIARPYDTEAVIIMA